MRKSSAWSCDTVRFTPQRQPISPQCSTKRRPGTPSASVSGSASLCTVAIDRRLVLSYISVKTELTEEEQAMRVLVLGGTGFIGRHVAAALAARGHEVCIGTRYPARAARRLPAALRSCELREVHFERLAKRSD